MKSLDNLSVKLIALTDLKQYFKFYFSNLVLLILLVGCDSFVEVDLPNSQLTSKSVFEDKTTANAAMTQVYAKMRDNGLFSGNTSGLSHLLGNYADELKFYGNPQDGTAAFYNNIVLQSNSAVKTLWNESYNQIYGANAVIEGVNSSETLAHTDRDQLIGEALFTRAFIHLYLTNLFGEIPYIKTTDYKKNAVAVKENPNTIYKYCIEDLVLAQTLLPSAYKTSDRTRPNKFAVHALLAKVYLYTQQWAESSNEASAVLNNTDLYVFENDLSKVFLKESKSTIWQFAPSLNASNTLEAQTFVFTIGPPPLSALSLDFINSFQPEDKRKQFWISSVSDGNAIWFYPSKYKSKSTTVSTEYSILLRLNEVYLIRSEARAHAGDLIGSKEDLNRIRNAAGLLNTEAVSQNEILQAILKERQIELFTELGSRFFDLKRFGVLDQTLSLTKSEWDSFESNLPIPETELNLNKNLQPQNTGY